MTKLFYFRTISNNNDYLWNDEIIPNNVNMQLAHPEPRQVATSAGDSSIPSNLSDKVSEKYDVL